MDVRLRISLICAVIVYFICIISLLAKKRLALKYTLLWIFGGLLMAMVLAFPKMFMALMNLFGIIEPVNGIFAFVFFLLILILISLTSVLSLLNNQVRSLAQKCALAEKRIRDLEKTREDEKKNEANIKIYQEV